MAETLASISIIPRNPSSTMSKPSVSGGVKTEPTLTNGAVSEEAPASPVDGLVKGNSPGAAGEKIENESPPSEMEIREEALTNNNRGADDNEGGSQTDLDSPQQAKVCLT